MATPLLLTVFGLTALSICGHVQSATIAENIFNGLSRACRIIMKTHSNERSLEDELAKLSILWLTQNGTRRVLLHKAAKYIEKNSEIFNENLTTVIILHGFNDDPRSAIPMAIADAYMQKDNYNIILLDSSSVTSGEYPRAAYMTQLIGRALSNFIIDLINKVKLNSNKVHIVGLSLGAQTAGWAGRLFRSNTARKLHRITGLDPAGPCFTKSQSGEHLYKDDAYYVDVIHVNAGVQGILENVGHADFFVNGGGPNQPGCRGPNCSHQRAGVLYLESMYKENSLLGRRCDSWISFRDGYCNDNSMSVMGYNCPAKSRGKFYLKTSKEHPYALGMKGASSSAGWSFFNLFNLFDINYK